MNGCFYSSAYHHRGRQWAVLVVGGGKERHVRQQRRHYRPSPSPSLRSSPCAAATSIPGALLGVPDLTKPSDLTDQWRRAWRPTLEASQSALALAASGANDAAFCRALDATLAPLRDVVALSAHIAARHSDLEWRKAAADVAEAVGKYERHLAADRGLARRLDLAERRLCGKLAGSDGGGDGGATDSKQRQQQQQQRDLCALCGCLRRALRRGAPAAASAARDAGAWAAALEARDGAQERLAALACREAELLAELGALMDDAALAPAVEVPASALGARLLRRWEVQGEAHSDGGGSSSNLESGSTGSSSGEDEAAAVDATADAAVPVVLTRAATAALLARAPGAAARRAAYFEGLLPRLRAGSALLAALARVRGEAAALCGAESYAELACRELAAPGPLEVAGFLQSVAAALRPLADAEVERALLQSEYAAGDAEGGSGPWDFEYLCERSESGGAEAGTSLRPYLQLDAALGGFSSLLSHLLGVALVARPPAPGEAWAPRVRVLTVVRRGRGVAGTIYVEPGVGGYGTRVVRHGPWRWLPRDGGDDLLPPPLSVEALWAAAQAQLQTAGGEPSSSGSSSSSGGAPWPPPAPAATAEALQRAAARAPAVAIGLGGTGGEADVLSLPLLFELGHELGHAVHLLLSSLPPDGDDSNDDGSSSSSSGAGGDSGFAHLTGRFLPPDLLELAPALFERALLDAGALALVLRDSRRGGARPPPALAAAAAARLRARRGALLAIQDRACAALAEALLGLLPDDPDAAETWPAAWAEFSSLPLAGAAGTGRQLALMPVVAAHRGTYFSYVACWAWAQAIWGGPAAPLLRACSGDGGEEGGGSGSSEAELARARAALAAAVVLRPGAPRGAEAAALYALIAEGGGSEGAAAAAHLWVPPLPRDGLARWFEF